MDSDSPSSMNTNMHSDTAMSKDAHSDSDTNSHTPLSGSILSILATSFPPSPMSGKTSGSKNKNAVNKMEKRKKIGKAEEAEEAEKVNKTSLLRAAMAKRIQDMVDDSTDDKMDGKVSIVYERLGDLQWLPGKGDGEFLRRIKHWRLIIQLGFDAFTLEFLENSIVSYQGVLLVSPYDQGASKNATLYTVGYLKGLSTEELYKWIQEQSGIWKDYNLLKNNCHHFVHKFLAHFENLGYLTRTDHLGAVRQKRQQEQYDQKSPSPEKHLPSVPQSEQSHFQQSQSEQSRPQQSQSDQPHPQLSRTQQHQDQKHQDQQHQDQHVQDQHVQDQNYLNHQYDDQAQQRQQYQDHQQQQEGQQVDQLCEQQWRSPKSDKGMRAGSSSSPPKARVAKARLGRLLGELGVKSKSFMSIQKREVT